MLLLRFAISAFRPSATFLAVHLADGDDRILPMTHREAEQTSRAIHEALDRRCQASGLAEPEDGSPTDKIQEPSPNDPSAS